MLTSSSPFFREPRSASDRAATRAEALALFATFLPAVIPLVSVVVEWFVAYNIYIYIFIYLCIDVCETVMWLLHLRLSWIFISSNLPCSFMWPAHRAATIRCGPAQCPKLTRAPHDHTACGDGASGSCVWIAGASADLGRCGGKGTRVGESDRWMIKMLQEDRGHTAGWNKSDVK